MKKGPIKIKNERKGKYSNREKIVALYKKVLVTYKYLNPVMLARLLAFC